MQRFRIKFVVVSAMLLSASVGWAADPRPAARAAGTGAVLSGIVRDAQGMAVIGALVQVDTSNWVAAATAVTDLHGRYLVVNLLPGKYYVRASAALFVPASRENLQLRSGARTVVDLTLSALFETASWIPAERRKADEPGDDWKWTLRSAANRPILRMVDDGQLVLISSSATEQPRSSQTGKSSVIGGDGSFGQGGLHNTLSLDRGLDDGSDVRLRVDLGTGVTPGGGSFAGRPSTEIQVGYQRHLGLAGDTRTVVSYQFHPELVAAGGTSGLEAMHLATAQKMEFGDLMEIQVGSALDLLRDSGYLATAHPFVRMTVHPSQAWAVGYRVATARDLQAYNSLDAVQPELPAAVMSQGHLQTEHGVHQEISLSRKAGPGILQASYYHDKLDNVLLSGGGALGAADLNAGAGNSSQAGGILADDATGDFKLLASGYAAQGINLILTEPLGPGLWAALEYEDGTALSLERSSTLTLLNLSTGLKPVAAQSATFAVKGKIVRSNTSLRAAYRWQPVHLVNAVDSYAAFSDQGYISFFIRQPLNCAGWLPPGLEGTVDVTNLLAQGYRSFLSTDGRTLYLAQAPRSLQAGLAFNF